MKKLVMILVVVVSVLSHVNAQQQTELPPAKDRAEMQTEMMVEKLNLTEEQTEKVLEVNLTAAQEVDNALKQTDRMAKFKSLRNVAAEKDKALKAILSKDQFKLYEQSKKEMQKALKDRRKENK